MPSDCWSKVIDALEARITPLTLTGEPLAGWTVLKDPSEKIAVQDDEKTIVIWPMPPQLRQSDELNQTFHQMSVDIEFVAGRQDAGILTRNVREAMAHVHAALAGDREFGGMLHDLQEIDIAPTTPGAVDTHAASVQYEAQFFTPRDDWFTIVGQGGATF